MYSNTFIHLYKVGLILTSILLNYRKYIYTHRLLSLPELYPAKKILPINLKKGNKSFQLEELPKNTLI